jgi:hypothetical protein
VMLGPRDDGERDGWEVRGDLETTGHVGRHVAPIGGRAYSPAPDQVSGAVRRQCLESYRGRIMAVNGRWSTHTSCSGREAVSRGRPTTCCGRYHWYTISRLRVFGVDPNKVLDTQHPRDYRYPHDKHRTFPLRVRPAECPHLRPRLRRAGALALPLLPPHHAVSGPLGGAMTRQRKAHTHEFLADTRPGWPGYVCRICGWRIPPDQQAPALAAGARFPEIEA